MQVAFGFISLVSINTHTTHRTVKQKEQNKPTDQRFVDKVLYIVI